MKFFILTTMVFVTTTFAATSLISSKSMDCTKLTQTQLNTSIETAYEFCKIKNLKTRACVQEKIEDGIDINIALKDC